MSWKFLNKTTPSQERMYRVILAPVITEKATLAGQHNAVVFKVAKDASKPEIKAAVEGIFDVKVKAVNTSVVKGKTKRFRGVKGVRSDWKKAVVRLEEGHSIDVGAGI